MQPEVSFLCGVAVTIVTSLFVAWWLKQPLRGVLTDICGTEARAHFWQAFTSVCLVLVPLVLTLKFDADAHRSSAVAAIASQLQGAAIAMVITLSVVGLALHTSIEHFQRTTQTSGHRHGAEAKQ